MNKKCRNCDVCTFYLYGKGYCKKNHYVLCDDFERKFKIDTNRFTKEQEYPLGMKYKDIWTHYHKLKQKITKENKMVKELTVAEISEALGYDVKVVKESTKPYQFKAGDVVEFNTFNSEEKRIFVEIKGVLYSLYLDGTVACYAKDKDRTFSANHYKKIGRLNSYIK